MIPKESVLRGVIKELNTISNNFIQKAPGNISIKIAISVLEAYLNTPEGWPEKRKGGEGIGVHTHNAYNQAREDCNLARLKEKQKEVPTVEEINEVLKTEGLCGTKTAKAVHKLIKSKQKEKASGRQRKTTPEEIIANYEKAKHSADSSTLVFNSKEQAEVPMVEWIRSLKKNIEEIGEVKLDLRVLPVLEKLLARLKEDEEDEEPTLIEKWPRLKEKQKGE